MSTWSEHARRLADMLHATSFTSPDGQELGCEEGFARWAGMTCRLRQSRGCLFLVGNGASASMASHFATDLAKNAGVRTQLFTDLSLITALANDICYEEVFAEPLRWTMAAGDMLVAISSSGNSPNVVRAVQAARNLGGAVVTLSGMKPDNAIRRLGDLNIYIDAPTYGLAESGHGCIMHYWMDFMEKDFAQCGGRSQSAQPSAQTHETERT